ncbi:hypothetical protein phiRS7_0044 [Staphylococcus phage phiRS7]|uniref:hypothetical protein n=1 Tax=Staphylococcus phage phiRS7 TaxID=1403390 RepID=UPI0003B0052E|nr:hypothetical protein [Staphylococcus saprophyticus]YP_008853767.1 hypothetical protein phiRS7_0044 [Staphylococcus phage phiRS7]CRV22850.1 Uncharacterised protein [Streptococcus equi subsp. equi]AGW43780.1 hypothetical protein phiRS7_0044 [Staphylococcus phage phiRS7]MDW3951028.1 hypothetical protein [Staphylococcus saprophyticus]MDW4145980.1 hypothetical protein [Staphylococcus saprophyticus]RXS16693.1 hypothetical protein EUA52_03695 [Staphylococcus saprophyticus]
MTIGQFQQLLGHLFRTTYKGDTDVQSCLLELGYTIKILLENGRLTPFDDYEENKNIIFKNYKGVNINGIN